MAQYMRLKRTLSVPYAHACLHGFLVSVSPRGTSALSFIILVEVGSVTTAPDGVVHRAQEQHPPSWRNTRENIIDVQLFHPYIYQKFLAKSQRKSHSGGTLHVRLLLLQGTLHVPQACNI